MKILINKVIFVADTFPDGGFLRGRIGILPLKSPSANLLRAGDKLKRGGNENID
ncbi:MAG: hypothetical protein PVG30_07445 [Gammaproteobacteria bacterium]|jgi:hypothetical protein